MADKDFVLREYSVRLRRCDRARGLESEQRPAAPSEPEAPANPEQTGASKVVIKTECDTEDIALQEEHMGLMCLPDNSKTPINSLVEQTYDSVVKLEDEEGKAMVKQELDVGPTVLTPQSAHQIRVLRGAYERSGPSGMAPALQTRPRTKVEDDCNEDSAVPSDSRLMFCSGGTDHDIQEGRQCGGCVKSQSECGCGTDTSKAKIDKRTAEQSINGPCNYYAITKSNLMTHIQTLVNNKPCYSEQCRPTRTIYKCGLCEYRASVLNHVKRHMRIHTGVKPYKCQQCDYSASLLSSLKTHLRSHMGGKPYKCQQCGYSASLLSNLKTHIRSHTGEKPYKCKYCEYSASQLGNLKAHMRTHTGEKRYKCEQCQYSASLLKSLKTHMRIHTGEKPYKCKQCEYSASQLSNLKTHMRTHTGEKPYKCEHCQYSASLLSSLKAHMRIHTGEKPYRCKQCEYSASQLSNLKAHMRIHTSEKLYKCEQCEYRASVLSSIRRHMRTHTGEKPYKCEQCEYRASRLNSLKTHMRTHTGKNHINVSNVNTVHLN